MCYCLDLRSDSKIASLLANKFFSIVVAAIQVIIWVSALFAFIVQPGSVKEQIQESPPGAIAFAVIFVLTAIGFSVLLMVGLLKNKRAYIQTFLVFIIVIIVLLVLSIIINIFTQPRRFGLSGFLSNTLVILVDILSYFVVRNYYLATSPKSTNQNHNVV